MNKVKSIVLGFATIILLMILSTSFLIFKLVDISQSTIKIYNHPFKVSNAVRSIKSDILNMELIMHNMIESKDKLVFLDSVRKIDEYERNVYQSYDLIYDRYLGDKKDIDTSFNVFKSWRPIRQDLINLMQDGKYADVEVMMHGDGENHISNLNEKIDKLLDFANNKAITFYTESQSKRDQSILLVTILAIFVTLFAIMIAYFIIRRLNVSQKYQDEYLHMIDQNILYAKFTKDFIITDITQQLCRSLNISKKNLVGTKSDFFFEDKNTDIYKNMMTLINSGKDCSSELKKIIEGRVVWFDILIKPEFSNAYEVNGYKVILKDITDKKLVEETSITDNLTKLYNRNYFDKIFPIELNRANREKKALCLMLLDIDYFKQYNDSYGHLQGDFALKSVGSVLAKASQRSYDFAFRVGGEEFALIFYNDDYKSACEYVEKIRQNVEKLKIEHQENKASKYVTVSIGFIYFSNPGHFTLNQMYEEVDNLLYQAKEKGRNQIITRHENFSF